MTLVVEESVYAVKALNRNDLGLKSKKIETSNFSVTIFVRFQETDYGWPVDWMISAARLTKFKIEYCDKILCNFCWKFRLTLSSRYRKMWLCW